MAAATRGRDRIEVISELINAGITTYGLLKAESRFLPKLLHKDEHIHAVVYGQHHSSSAMLVATDERIIYLDKKPMAVFLDEVTYDVVSGIELDIHTFFATITLHTAVKNYEIRFANLGCAANFASYIEAERLKREQEKIEERKHIPLPEREKLTKQMASTMIKNDLAGYYWYPPEEREEALAGPGPDQLEWQ